MNVHIDLKKLNELFIIVYIRKVSSHYDMCEYYIDRES